MHKPEDPNKLWWNGHRWTTGNDYQHVTRPRKTWIERRREDALRYGLTESEAYAKEKYLSEGYEVLRNGWPDFLLIKDGHIEFREVKGPNDKMSEGQIRMHDVLKKAGFKISVTRVTEAELYGTANC